MGIKPYMALAHLEVVTPEAMQEFEKRME